MCIVCYSAIMAGVMYRYCNAIPPCCFVLAAIREIECANTLKHSILHLAIISCLGWKFVDAFSLHAKQECTHLEKMQRTMFSLDNLFIDHTFHGVLFVIITYQMHGTQ